MKLEVLESEKDRLALLVKGEDHTLLNILKENAWRAGAKQASYVINHPYMSEPKLMIRGLNPRKILSDSAQMAVDEAKEFTVLFSREIKK